MIILEMLSNMLVAIWATVYSMGSKGIGKKTNYSAVFGSKKNL